jgi:uncharacterized protein
MKYLLVLVVIGVLWMLFKRSGSRIGRDDDPSPPTVKPTSAMLACAHCGLHLPQAEVVADAAGRPYCSDTHRAAGPR